MFTGIVQGTAELVAIEFKTIAEANDYWRGREAAGD